MQTLNFVFAYLDAGTGSMILQVVLGGAAAVAVGGRVLWHRMTGRGSKAEAASTENQASAPAGDVSTEAE